MRNVDNSRQWGWGVIYVNIADVPFMDATQYSHAVLIL